jgi:hypothetical protein
VGEPIAAKLEQAVDFIKAIVVGGPAAAIKWITDKIGEIKDMVMDQIRSFIQTRVIMAGVQWLIGLLNPAAAFIKACKMIYDLVMWIVDNAGRIKEFVDAVLGSVEEILAGGVGKVAGMIEDALSKAIPMVIGVFASLLGLGGLSEKIKSILQTVQGPVNKAFDFLIGKAVKLGRRFMGALKKSKLGRAYGKGKELVKRGKQWAKKKAEAGKKWVKKKGAALKSKAAEALDLFKLGTSFSSGRGGSHRVFNSPAGSSDLMMASNESGPVVKKAKALADPKLPTNTSVLAQIEASYSRYRAVANAAATRTRSPKGNYAARKRVLKGFLAEFTGLLRQLKLSGEKVGRPPGIWNVARHTSQPSRMREHPIKVWHMESEHIIPRGMLSSAFKALAQAGIPGGGADYGDMRTLMVYKRVAEGKTRGDGGDWVEIGLFKEAMSVAVGNFVSGRESDQDAAAERLSGVVLSRLDEAAGQAVSRTKEEMVMEHVANGDIRGKAGTTDSEPTPPENKVDEAFKGQRTDINRQLKARISRFLRNRSRRKEA